MDFVEISSDECSRSPKSKKVRSDSWDNSNEPMESKKPTDDTEIDMLLRKYTEVPIATKTKLDLSSSEDEVTETKIKTIRYKETIDARKQKSKSTETDKLERMITKLSNKDAKIEEALKNIRVIIDTKILEEFDEQIFENLQREEVKYEIRRQQIDKLITWMRETKSYSIGMETNELETKTTQEETNEALMITNYRETIEGDFITRVKNVQKQLKNRKLSLIIYGVKKNQRKQLEDVLINLQLIDCFHNTVEKTSELAAILFRYTKSIAQLPFKVARRQQMALEWDLDFDVGGDNRCTIGVTKEGVGLERLWKETLMTFPLVNLEIAEAIVREYPTPSVLRECYRKAETIDGAVKLLQDIDVRRPGISNSNGRRIGPELSRKIYNFFTSNDGDLDL